jgi:hypothetical protein
MRLPTLCLVREKMSELPEFREIGKRMLLAWQEGVTTFVIAASTLPGIGPQISV